MNRFLPNLKVSGSNDTMKQKVNKLTLPLLAFTLTGLSARADSNLEALRNHAGQVYMESMSIKQMLKQKSPDLELIRQKVETTKEDVAKIQHLVSEVENSSSSILKSDPATWEEIKLRASVLAVIHDHKAALTSEEGLRKQRSILRAHVDGVAIRAVKLQELLNRMERKARPAS
jgi:hypothetical protein